MLQTEVVILLYFGGAVFLVIPLWGDMSYKVHVYVDCECVSGARMGDIVRGCTCSGVAGLDTG